jgi:hypothetical protein
MLIKELYKPQQWVIRNIYKNLHVFSAPSYQEAEEIANDWVLDNLVKFGKSSKYFLSKYKGDINEGLTAKDSVAKWIEVFKKSSHPKFKGKTPEQREKTARAAHLQRVQNQKFSKS